MYCCFMQPPRGVHELREEACDACDGGEGGGVGKGGLFKTRASSTRVATKFDTHAPDLVGELSDGSRTMISSSGQ